MFLKVIIQFKPLFLLSKSVFLKVKMNSEKYKKQPNYFEKN